MTLDMELDMNAVGAFAEQVGTTLMGGATTAMMLVGDRLGMYAALARSGPTTPDELAGRTGTTERYVREWLAQQAATGFVTYDAAGGTFELPPAHAAVLATDESPVSMIGATPLVTGMHRGVDRVVEAFRTGEGIPWGDHDGTIFESAERFFGVDYRNNLVETWVPALDGVHDRLTAGASVADVGCGHGGALIMLALAYPQSRFIGFDVHPPSVETARARAATAGVGDRVRFEVDHCHGYEPAGYDLVTFFATLHDLGDPVGAAAHAREALADDGTLMVVESLAGDTLAETLTMPGAALNFAASTFLCTSNSLSQPVGAALGAQAGERRLTEVLRSAGYESVRRAAESRLHMVLEARP